MTAASDLLDLAPSLGEPPLGELCGRFHSHITVRVEPERLPLLQQVARSHQAKVTVIDLEGESERAQRDIMTTRYHLDDAPGALGRISEALARFAADLEGAGLPVLRVKVEHESEPSLQSYTDIRYHEVHIKLSLDEPSFARDRAWLAEQAPRMRWVPSRNPYERRDGRVVQFVTMRCYEGDRASADRMVDAALSALSARELQVVEVKRENTVLDTHRAHDAWWI